MRLRLGASFSGNKHLEYKSIQGDLQAGGQYKEENTDSQEGHRLPGLGVI